MVQVRQTEAATDDGRFSISHWVASLDTSASCAEAVSRACVLARDAELGTWHDVDEAPGDSAFFTGLEMARILRDLKLEGDALVAAILYRVVRGGLLSEEAVRADFGSDVAALIGGVQQMAAISRTLHPEDQAVLGQQQTQADNVRRMLVSLIDDPRIALIKLADRCCAIRGVKNYPEKQKKVAQEIFHIYAPLAHRLGIGQLKWELEDLAFRYLQPADYRQIAGLLDERRLDRQAYIESVIGQLDGELRAQGLAAQVQGRPKHIYSIWRKMQNKRIGFSEVYDVRAVRILTERLQDCYAVLGVVHTLWPNISSEFDDYVANPKVNGYQSLHTAVYGPGGKVLEVQIRTFSMHEAAEIGVCSHWQYKGVDPVARGKDGYDQKLDWLRQLLAWHDEIGEQALAESDNLAVDRQPHRRIYVFTPDGHVVDLPEGATPVDFAYHIHTEVGHRCRGAKVNGRIVPLGYQLDTGQQVEILTAKEAAPRRDWLRYDLGYVRSSRSRSSIQQWFRMQAREQNLLMGRQALEREFKRLALTSVDYKALANHFKYASVEDMYVAAGAGDLGAAQVIAAAQLLVEDGAAPREAFVAPPRNQSQDNGISVRGVGQLLTSLAGCCHPLPGDDIVGYITVGRGVTIHRSDCHKLLQLRSAEAQRLIEVDWGASTESCFPATILVEAFDRTGLLRDISALLAGERANVITVNTGTNRQDNMARMQLTLEVAGLDVLSRLLARINQLPNVIAVRRVSEV